MKNKVLSILLSMCMIVGITACGNQNNEIQEESSSPIKQGVTAEQISVNTDPTAFAGRELKTLSYGCHAVNELADVSGSPYANELIHIAAHEWGAINGCQITAMDGVNWPNMMDLIAAGDQPDLFLTSGVEINIRTGMVQDLSEYYEYFKNKYGEKYTDDCLIDGKWYGLLAPFSGDFYIIYNSALLKSKGIKTPREYFMEDNWNWETFRQLLQDVTEDTDGDGVNDVVGMGIDWMFDAFCPIYSVAADGSVINNMETDMSYDFYQMLYEGYTVDGTLCDGYFVSPNKNSAGQRVELGLSYFLNGVTVSAVANRTNESVPVPYYQSEENAFIANMSHYFFVPQGVDKEAAVALMDYVMSISMNDLERSSVANCLAEDILDEWPELQGLTDMSVKRLKQEKDEIQESADVIAKKKEQDPDFEAYVNKLIDYYENTRVEVWHQIPGIPHRGGEGIPDSWNALWTKPSATSVAEISPILQSLIDEYHSLYMEE